MRLTSTFLFRLSDVRPRSALARRTCVRLPWRDDVLAGGLPRRSWPAPGGARPVGGARAAAHHRPARGRAGARRPPCARHAAAAGFRPRRHRALPRARRGVHVAACSPPARRRPACGRVLPASRRSACRRAGRRGSRSSASSACATVSGTTACRTTSTWGQVLGALVDGFDMVVFGAAAHVRPGTARRVQSGSSRVARCCCSSATPGPSRATSQVTSDASWDGLGDGHGHLRLARVDLAVDGRRIPRTRHDVALVPGRVRDGRTSTRLAVPDPTASVPSCAAAGEPIPLRRTG